jgi:hypothetical protein
MVEVFKTNVKDRKYSLLLLAQIHNTFTNYKANFDLDDCDKILRVECADGIVEATLIIELVRQSGFHAEILEDVCPPGSIFLLDETLLQK